MRRLKARAKVLQRGNMQEGFDERKQAHLARMIGHTPVADPNVDELYRDAEAAFPSDLSVSDLLTKAEQRMTDARIGRYIADFNERFGLDRWDYAIAGSCGLVGAMFDLLCVSVPPKPTVAWTKEVDGIFNRAVQRAFNKVLPPEVSSALAAAKIGTADASMISQLVGAPPGTLNPLNHRLRALSHEPCIGVSFRRVGHDAWYLHGGWGRRDNGLQGHRWTHGHGAVRVAGTHVRTLDVGCERAIGERQPRYGFAPRPLRAFCGCSVAFRWETPVWASRSSTCT